MEESDNHSIAYCLLGYLCAYYRYYHPFEFITAFLNNAANDEDIRNGTALAKQRGISITHPKFGVSKGQYFFNREKGVIAKGLSSVKYMSEKVSDELYELAQGRHYDYFVDLLADVYTTTSIDARQVEVLTKIDFFDEFGNQRELFAISELFEKFKRGTAKQMKKDAVSGSPFEEIIKAHSTGKTKAGGEAKSYTLLDTPTILRECEGKLLSMHVGDISLLVKVNNFIDVMGYAGYVTGKEEDRRKLYIRGVFPVKRKRDGAVFGYSVLTQSIGSGIESRMTVFKKRFEMEPIKEGDIILCKRWAADGAYFQMTDYEHLLA